VGWTPSGGSLHVPSLSAATEAATMSYLSGWSGDHRENRVQLVLDELSAGEQRLIWVVPLVVT